jgi:hypothetical protein
MVTALAQVAAGTVAVATFEFAVSCQGSLDAICERDVGVPEAVIPLAGPFVALGARGGLHPGLQAVLGISGALQVIGLATIIVGSTIQRPVDPKVGFSVGADGQGAFVSVSLPL